MYIYTLLRSYNFPSSCWGITKLILEARKANMSYSRLCLLCTKPNNTYPPVLFWFTIILANTISHVHCATFSILNNCSFPVWAAAVPGGGLKLNSGEQWTITASANTTSQGRIWARTGCNFNGTEGHCETGDCDGQLKCTSYGSPPNTLAEYSFNTAGTLDFFDISLIDGFNVPMEFRPDQSSSNCSAGTAKCLGADINDQCPNELRSPGGCNNPCTVFKTDSYCCTNSNSTPSSCGPTDYSRFFKERCPDAYSYPYDDKTSTFSCPAGTEYLVVFCSVSAKSSVDVEDPSCSFGVINLYAYPVLF